MSDIASNLPVRAGVGDVVVNVLGGATGGVIIDPAAEGTLVSVLEGVTGISAIVATEATQAEVLAGVTGIAAIVATEATQLDVLAGVTAGNAVAADILAGVTGIADVVATETTQLSVLAGVTAISDKVALEATQLNVLAGITAGNALSTDILAGVTGIEDALATQLPAALGATGMAASLSITVAADQTPVPVYVTDGPTNTPVVQFKTTAAVASAGTSVDTYTPATEFVLDGVHAAGSGRIKLEVRIGAIADIDLATSLKWVGFNSTSNPNVDIPAYDFTVAVGEQIKVVVTNMENQAQDLYSTIVGNL